MNDVAAIVMERSPAEEARDAVVQWLACFEAALVAGNATSVAALFAEECHYRDMLAFSWTIRPARGADPIAAFLTGARKTIGARNFAFADQGDRADTVGVAHDGAQGDPWDADGVPVCARRSTGACSATIRMRLRDNQGETE